MTTGLIYFQNHHLCHHIVIILLLGYIAHASFEVTPQNTLVKKGESVDINCSAKSDSNTQLSNLKWVKDGNIQIPNGQVDTGYKDPILNNTLHITTALESDAGNYTCQLWLGEELLEQRTATLVVFEERPSISPTAPTILENTQVEFTCSLKYWGGLIPKVKWNTDVAYEKPNLIVGGSIIQGNKIMFNLLFNVTSSCHHRRVQCSIAFGDYPEQLTASSGKMNVKYKPCDMNIRRVESSFALIQTNDELLQGESVKCGANSYPDVTKWRWTFGEGDNSIILGETETIVLDTMSKGRSLLQCTASNGIGNNSVGVYIYLKDNPTSRSISTTATVGIHKPTSPETSNQQPPPSTTRINIADLPENRYQESVVIISSSTSLIIIILIITLISVIVVMRRNRKKSETDNLHPFVVAPATTRNDTVRNGEIWPNTQGHQFMTGHPVCHYSNPDPHHLPGSLSNGSSNSDFENWHNDIHYQTGVNTTMSAHHYSNLN